MNSELASLFLATITSGVVTSLILYLAKSWITERLKQAIAHEYAQKLEAHRAALKSDYDVQLERLRAENTKQLAVEASARSSLSDAYKAAHERRIAAIEQAWAIMLKVPSVIAPQVFISNLLTDVEQEDLPKSKSFQSLVLSSQADPLEKRLPRATAGLNEIRLLVGDRIHTLVFVYQAIFGRIEYLMKQSLEKKRLDPWWKDSHIHYLLGLVLSQDEVEDLQHGEARLTRLQSMFETKFLQECQPILSGEAAAHFSLKQSMAIQEAIRASSGQSLVNSPPE